MLDLSHISAAEHNFVRFSTRAKAVEAAPTLGWNTTDVMRAYNRINTFWVVGKRLENEMQLATWTHGSVRLPVHPRYSS